MRPEVDPLRDQAAIDDRSEDELAVQALGTTVVRTAEGWEEAEYVEPGDDWQVLGDGSYLSSDGTIRSWPLAGPTEE